MVLDVVVPMLTLSIQVEKIMNVSESGTVWSVSVKSEIDSVIVTVEIVYQIEDVSNTSGCYSCGNISLPSRFIHF